MMKLFSDWLWQPMISPVQIAAIAVVMSAVSLWAYLRSRSGSRLARTFLLLMRLALVGTLAMLLMGPSKLPPSSSEKDRCALNIMLDTSQSMLTEDCRGKTRMDFLQDTWIAPKMLDELSRDYRVKILAFDSSLRPLQRSQCRLPAGQLAKGDSTEMAGSVVRAISTSFSRRENNAALLILSDGHDTEESPIEPAATLAQRRNVPVYTVAVGAATGKRDATLMATPLQEFLLPDEPGGVLVKVYQSGLGQEEATLRFENGGKTDEIPVRFDNQPFVEVRLDVQHEKEGQYEYKLTLDPVPGETVTDNNSQSVFCEVQRRRIRVLLVEGQPFWDTKFVAQALRKDDRIEMTQVTQVTDRHKETIVTRGDSTNPKMPTSSAAWSANYDVVILGRDVERLMKNETAAALRGFVINGGHVIFARGKPHGDKVNDRFAQSLATLQPVVWGYDVLEDLQVTLTPAGRASQWLSQTKMGVNVEEAFAELPGFTHMTTIARPKSAAIILATAKAGAGSNRNWPAIATMSVGRGTTMSMLGEGSWKWSLLPPNKLKYAGLYDTLWSNLVRWLVMGGDFQPGAQVSMRLSRQSVRLDDKMTVDISFKNPPGDSWTAQLTSPTGKQRQLKFTRLPSRDARFRAEIEPSETGTFLVDLSTPGIDEDDIQRRFHVYDTNLERLNTASRPMPLRILAEHSGGAFLDPDKPQELIQKLKQIQSLRTIPPQPEYLWDNASWMAILLVWAGLEWIFRRLAGLY